ncbi:hypothetical protein JCM10213_008563 [Rhodosporidiobolus nylandii]
MPLLSLEQLQQHVAGHVAEAAPHPKQERDHEQEFKRQHGSPLEGATAGGERPHPHAELSMPELNRKTGEAEPAAAHPDQPR